MKNITDQLFELGEGIITKFPEVSDNAGKYHMADDGGIETEVGEFLYGLMRVIQPLNILTTGIYTGISDMYIAQALKDNGQGHSMALEIEKSHLDRAEELWRKVGVAEWVTAKLQSALDFQPQGEYDFVFLDTECNQRWSEFNKFFDFVKPGGFIALHDLHRHLGQHANEEHGFAWPWGRIPDEIVARLKIDKLRVFSFSTPRGLTIFYKTHPDDYRWN